MNSAGYPPSQVGKAPVISTVPSDQGDAISVASASTKNESASRKPQEEEKDQYEPPYSVFSHQYKWFIVSLAAYAGMFSPLAANIYFPAIPTLTKAFHKTTQQINLTVTVYMIFQGITPTLWGAFADTRGRRPVYIAALTLFLCACIGLALIPTSAYWLLIVLRCVSSSGSAVVIALGSGTVSDIAHSSERGKYAGTVMLGPMLGPCIGPVFGGLLNQHLGWRSIFWFLAILVVCALVPITLFFPETLRSIRGNGAVPATGINRTLWEIVKGEEKCQRSEEEVQAGEEVRKKALEGKKNANPFIALTYFSEKDVGILLAFLALNYVLLYSIVTTLSTVVESNYSLTPSQAGFCYLPLGLGLTLGSLATGRLVDRDFRMTQKRIETRRVTDAERARMSALSKQSEKGETGEAVKPLPGNRVKMSAADLAKFPLEHARLRSLPIYCLVEWVPVIIYGWLVQYRVNLAAPLVLLFFVGYGQMGISQTCQVLLLDLYPGNGASIIANNNLGRCLIGAAGTAVVDPLMKAIKIGPTLMVFTALPACFSPFLILEWKHGMRWRVQRALRERAKLGSPN